MHVLVTGGNGFIGSAVCNELVRQGHTYSMLDRPLDIRNVDDIATAGQGCKHVIHLAGVLGTHELFDTPNLAVDVNVQGTLNILEWCKETKAGFTGITMPQVFPSVYTATKIGATALASAYNHTHKVKVSHVRAYNAFGPGQAHGPGHPQKIIPTFAVNAWDNAPIPVWGDGSQTVDLIWTNDLANMLVCAMQFGDNEVFDGGTGYALTVLETAFMVQDLAHPGTAPLIQFLPMRRGERPTDIVAQGEGWDKLATLGNLWTPPAFRAEDLDETVERYRTWPFKP